MVFDVWVDVSFKSILIFTTSVTCFTDAVFGTQSRTSGCLVIADSTYM